MVKRRTYTTPIIGNFERDEEDYILIIYVGRGYVRRTRLLKKMFGLGHVSYEVPPPLLPSSGKNVPLSRMSQPSGVRHRVENSSRILLRIFIAAKNREEIIFKFRVSLVMDGLSNFVCLLHPASTMIITTIFPTALFRLDHLRVFSLLSMWIDCLRGWWFLFYSISLFSTIRNLS